MKNSIKQVYFIGIGGIGMSALARYFRHKGLAVAGYDRMPTELIQSLASEGMIIHHTDNPDLIPSDFRNPATTLVIYTPAVPDDHRELQYFRFNGFTVKKRAEVLGEITARQKTIAIAGTHGKTTTTCLTAHILKQSPYGCNAFMGGIAKNYDANLLLDKNSEYTVVEADEYDRSFLHLSPLYVIATSMDAEHLDIYGTHEAMINAYHEFFKKIRSGGILLHKKGIPLPAKDLAGIQLLSYSPDSAGADCYPAEIKEKNGYYSYLLHTPSASVNIQLGIPGFFNMENSVAAASLALSIGIPPAIVQQALQSFKGVKRRFDYQLHSEKLTYIDDYAHHPEEIKACILSARKIFKGRKLTGIFQPHLYSRTKDFYKAFAESLSLLDKVFLLDIYPAREKPIEGVSSALIYDHITLKEKVLCSMDELLNKLEKEPLEVLITMGAGNIDKLVQPIRELLKERIK